MVDIREKPPGRVDCVLKSSLSQCAQGSQGTYTESGLTMTSMMAQSDWLVVNSLPETLGHFEREMLETWGALGGREDVFRRFPGDGAAKVEGAIARLAKYLRFCRAVRAERQQTLVLWPLLGWLEVIVWGLAARRRTAVMFHDPVPLRRQVGMGKPSRFMARALRPLIRNLEIIALSQEAKTVLEGCLPGFAVRCLPHPILNFQAQVTGDSPPRDSHPRVLVLGQYKPARDTDLLGEISPWLAANGIDGAVRGRGWPEVQGWDVQDRFLSEAEFDAELRAASVLLLPYRNYFQSNVAVRAIELGVPVVGRRTNFLEEMLGSAASTIVADGSVESWGSAILTALHPDSSRTGPSPWERVSAAWLEFDE